MLPVVADLGIITSNFNQIRLSMYKNPTQTALSVMFIYIQWSFCKYLSNKQDVYKERHRAEDDEEDFPSPGSTHLSRKEINNCCCYSL